MLQFPNDEHFHVCSKYAWLFGSFFLLIKLPIKLYIRKKSLCPGHFIDFYWSLWATKKTTTIKTN